MREIHLAGAFRVAEILAYNRYGQAGAPFDTFFPISSLCSDVRVLEAGTAPVRKGAVLVVINLNQKVWKEIQPGLASFEKRILAQTEAYIGYETAYDHAKEFDVFVNFDSTYASHPGFLFAYVPYIPRLSFSRRDLRGWAGMQVQWNNSRRVFLDAYLLRFLPRHAKACMIATLHPAAHYQNRLRVARRWSAQVDVFGGAWPADLPSWRGSCGDKIAVASRYRYALVMENQRQPGYITEKLLDAFASGTVPIYWGAPDVDNLPGAEAIIPFDEQGTDLHGICSSKDYHSRRRILLRERRKLFDMFSPERFTRVLKQALDS